MWCFRRSVRSTFGEGSSPERLAALRSGAGLWKDRDFSGAEYVDAIRGDLDELAPARARVRLIDTTIAVDYLRGRQAAVDLLEGLLGSEEPVVASELVRFELLAGARDNGPALPLLRRAIGGST